MTANSLFAAVAPDPLAPVASSDGPSSLFPAVADGPLSAVGAMTGGSVFAPADGSTLGESLFDPPALQLKPTPSRTAGGQGRAGVPSASVFDAPCATPPVTQRLVVTWRKRRR